ncbi:MAG: hypothetical protein A3D39_00460 [Candidatus Buchananbacteria bacterium RIFCSPHIGHO2_02_FULL_39_17]|uniref:DUF5615 domain-containing protein n=1 Tax=Candidatus Buchananbacteria bacterium RIFCSPLOWO2_01_FULL_40_23b TaxID=1797544 RepID=A0A1G1YTA6_9BACT|nr:MAG: hypothetical protein A3D39_00460 [Candidatus Buchananbacteria bacterium RIFCSPHIGHO2_02_FULL_39_17]OGY55585.1 MAG: hypothetical protein A2912_01570 [Candidatus Buchananbacteria bacterium RIFCSPLOWO2_01_FULL_40_23b]
MNAVIDEDLHRSLADVLKQLGFQIFDVRDHGLRGQSDEKVYAFAQKKKAVLFSADLGFSNILSFPIGTHQSIVILRFPNEMPTEEINRLVFKVLLQIKKEDYTENLIILSPKKIRIRRK